MNPSMPDILVGANAITISDTAPTEPNDNDLWFDTVSKRWMYADTGVWYGAKIQAADVIVDDTSFVNIVGTDLQTALASIDTQLT